MCVLEKKAKLSRSTAINIIAKLHSLSLSLSLPLYYFIALMTFAMQLCDKRNDPAHTPSMSGEMVGGKGVTHVRAWLLK